MTTQASAWRKKTGRTALESLLTLRHPAELGGARETSLDQDRIQPDRGQAHARILPAPDAASAQILDPLDPAVLMHQEHILLGDLPFVEAPDENARVQLLAQLPVLIHRQGDGIHKLAAQRLRHRFHAVQYSRLRLHRSPRSLASVWAQTFTAALASFSFASENVLDENPTRNFLLSGSPDWSAALAAEVAQSAASMAASAPNLHAPVEVIVASALLLRGASRPHDQIQPRLGFDQIILHLEELAGQHGLDQL